ncbi:hypothetical protein I3842_10G004700 [Carya illinoinensis]|uniref:Mitochondrial import inner membrane translocase subunit TIM50 n=1 Tax=Carya illinoinensis TaxID=32201 RepID=A0A922DSX5_CARIL|nr:hypothetical protein I3842_10G004700 [Carya illinoinensis]
MAEKITNLKNKCVAYDYSEDENVDAEEDFGLSLEKLNLGPRKKVIVLGLGGLLCHRVCRREESNIPRFRIPDASYGSFLVYRRPYCEEFMRFCLERFQVGIWSSAREWYLNSALDCIMKGLKSKLLFAWDQERCTDSGYKTLENRNKSIFFKDFKKLGIFGVKYSTSNILLIDDKPYKTLLNPPHTAIFPDDEYKADQINDVSLGPKGQLRAYLDGLADAVEVPTYVKGHPFGQPAITKSHPDWEYYSKITDRFQTK